MNALFDPRRHVIRKLNTVYENAREIDLSSENGKYVFFSDHHRGDRGVSDYFNEKTYNAALGYYLERDYTLVHLGDVEEFWEFHPRKVIEAYPLTYELESAFHLNKRFIKIYGNHDNLWRNPQFLEEYMGSLFPGLTAEEAMKIVIRNEEGKKDAEIFITHGHQGTFMSDTLDWFARFWLRTLQGSLVRMAKQKYQTPATNYAVREKHERIMFEWAESINHQNNHKILFIAGHTHHPIFMSRKIIKRIEVNIEQLKQSPLKKNRKLAAQLRSKLEYIKADLGPDMHFMTRQSCYFNTGCCSFNDGSITGIELSRSKIKLIKWMDVYNGAERVILGSEKIKEI